MIAVLIMADISRVDARPFVSALGSPYCDPVLPHSKDRGTEIYPVADTLFLKHNYKEAAKAYLQTFVCQNDHPLFVGLNSLVYDAQKVQPFEAAISEAAHGRFAPAALRLKNLEKDLPPFNEAGYLAGVFLWANGNHLAARAAWHEVVGAPHFAMSDFNEPSDAQRASLRMLHRFNR